MANEEGKEREGEGGNIYIFIFLTTKNKTVLWLR